MEPVSKNVYKPDLQSVQSNRERLVEDALPEVRRLARKMYESHPFYRNLVTLRDLEHEGVVALLECAKIFRPGKSEKLMSFAKQRVEGRMMEQFRRRNAWNVGRGTLTDSTARGVAIAFDNLSAKPSVSLDRKLLRRTLSDLIDRLSDSQAVVMRRQYFDEAEQQEIAKELGVTPSRVSQLHCTSLDEMRQYFEHRETFDVTQFIGQEPIQTAPCA